MIREAYQSVKKYMEKPEGKILKYMNRGMKFVAGGVLFALCVASYYNLDNPVIRRKRGLFIDFQTGEKYIYQMSERKNSRGFAIWPEDNHSLIASESFDDKNIDGLIDSEGKILSHKLEGKSRERAQRLYNLVLDNFQK